MIVKTRLVSLVGAAAVTIWPFIFVHPDWADDQKTIDHEKIHLAQQFLWVKYGMGVGVLFWFLLYCLCLPVGINPFRRKWETEAYSKGSKLGIVQINEILKKAPYFLWW